MFVDSHCHLDKLNLEAHPQGLQDIINNAKAANVHKLLSVGVTLGAFPGMMKLIEPYPEVMASCGVHPLDVESDFSLTTFKEYVNHPRVVAVGETGLDYHYMPETADLQKQRFEQQVEVAVEVDKPLIIHTRDAREDTLSILRNGHAERCGGVIHCFTEDLPFAEAAMDLGFYISISGIVTFKQAKELKDVVRDLPLERLLIETDSPYLAPVPHRGKENQPAYVVEVAAYIAQLKGISLNEVGNRTSENYDAVFLRR
ncbi:metal-dependent hydrolase [Vibrio sp. 10N.286.49.C2]|uniref:TatD family hydrolase n=1 Tax=unclassified Vibrio TaxID=2614977 RepID=UPI000C844A19|nr:MULTISPECIES: TatD family hydrolase [unclassified Vibrio]PMH33742.1 metal-dependent hydrolase [Vibrio sp. 10N.286.49.C2]PMH43999.1 metal-dependent hydrolase [Vibrio sp. 10N.286.49.B1]PMH78743.1 metal-dependent hydrolase [Vibrio sp. 10N.286.48.B7]